MLRLRPRPIVFSSCHELLWDATCKSANDNCCAFTKAARRSTVAGIGEDDAFTISEPEIFLRRKARVLRRVGILIGAQWSQLRCLRARSHAGEVERQGVNCIPVNR